MGRKIPGKKHRGVRDPAVQQSARFKSLKDKINAPPTESDEQFIPKSLSRIIELKDKVKSGFYNNKRTKIAPDENKSGFTRGKYVKPSPKFIQAEGESDGHFMNRINKLCASVIQEAAFEKKYRVEVKRNPETGKIEDVVKREKDEIDELMKRSKKKKNSGKKVKEETKIKLTKYQKRQEKLKGKKEKRSYVDIDEFKNYEDKVEFGEVVNAPPQLTFPKKDENAHRPGRKGLLLKSILKNPETPKLKKIQNKTIDKKGKRKNLPGIVRKQLDTQQNEIIRAYKELKGKKYNL